MSTAIESAVSTLRVATFTGWVDIQARFYGPLAVHRKIGWEAGGDDVVAITHVATGMKAAEDIPRTQVLSLVRKLLALDWSFTSPVDIPEATKRSARMILGIRCGRRPSPLHQTKRYQQMICTKCGAEVPDNQLACSCFMVAADNEIETRGLKAFASGSGIYLTTAPTSGYHLMPNARGCLSLCHKKRFGRPENKLVFSEDVLKKGAALKAGAKPDWCVECLTKALQSANAGKSQSVADTREERQPQKTR